jgi:probable rRNA maturation factor
VPPIAAGPSVALLDVELIGSEYGGGRLAAADVEQLCALALASAGIEGGHVAIELVDEGRIRALNREHRGRDAPTDVLSFPVDAGAAIPGPRELGDVVICPERAGDLREAVVHGALHLAGMDHERDDGEMLALQREILRWVGP